MGRMSVIRSVARRVRSSASVKSSVNQPVRKVVPKTREVRRSANSGRRGDVGGAGELVLVPHDERAVAAEDQVGLDQVGALVDGELVRAAVCSGR